MTNSAFQSGGVLLNILSALAIHLLKCVAKAEWGVLRASPLWKAELVIRRKWVYYFLNDAYLLKKTQNA